MAMKWSDEQIKAIKNNGHNILVSAGAGSGKTAVLSERIYQLVKEGYPITRFLVLTFTNAAAMEMKSRVRDKILDDSELAHLAPDIENAHIETFDAFCLFLVKKYAAVLNISPSLIVIDQAIMEVEKNKIIDAEFQELYQDKDPVFEEMVIKFSIKNDDRLKMLIKDIIKLASLQLDKEKFYSDFDALYLREEFIKKLIEQEFKNNIQTLESLKPLIEEIEEEKDAQIYEEILNYYLSAENYDELRELSCRDDKPDFGRANKATEAKNYIKDVIKKVAESDYGDTTFIISTFNSYKKYISLLVKIAYSVDATLEKFQKDHNAYSFSDIAKMAIKLVRDDSLVKEMSELFDFILVDEYQDTSDVQEEVITRLSKDNLYMVGDVKQSIYRFRNANCNIFNDKFNCYKNGNGGEEIDLNKSFRSRQEIVDAINDIFGQLMTKDKNIIDYENGHNFEFGNEDYSSQIQKDANYNVDIATYSLEENETSFEKEMGIITSDIIRKINSGYKVVDKKNGFRPCTYKDFAIIIDRKTKFDDIKKYFTDKNIPISAIQDESLKSSQITYITKNLINLFFFVKSNEYENEFKHAYCSIARSFLMRKKDSDIYREIKFNVLEELDITKRIKTVVDNCFDCSLFEILTALYDEFDVYNKIPSIGDCSASAHKCDVFLNYAKNMDSLGFCLKDMMDFFNEIIASDDDISFSDSSSADNAVTLINIHKSKGLEYPIVYFPFLSVKFNRNQKNSSFIADQKYGVNLPLLGRNTHDSFLQHLIKEKDTKEDFEEKLRLFYVALTRAREKIVMIINQSKLEKKIFDVRKANNFVSIIGSINYGKYLSTYEISDEKLNLIEDEKKEQNITIKSVTVEAKELVRKRASKQKTVEANEGALEFGTRLHYALELLNYETKDLTFINDKRIKRYVENVVNSFIFENAKNAKILHEYHFYDEVNDVNGIIDCLIIKENEINIVDFKLKNILDVHYDEQLNIYADYVKKISNLPIKKYLISAITGEVREVE